MPRKKKPPAYLKRQGRDGTPRARTIVRWPDGRVEEKSLGAYGSPESYAEHERLCAEWRAAQSGQAEAAAPSLAGPDARMVRDVLSLFWEQDVAIRRAGKKELDGFRYALRPLRRLYGHTLARDFGPRALKALRLAMATGSWLTDRERAAYASEGRPVGWSRKYLNRHLWRIKAAFGWAESEELVPRGTRHALDTVKSLREDEPLGLDAANQPIYARETDDVPPAPETAVAAVLTGWSLRRRVPLLNPVAAALVELQLLSAARPGELLRLCPADIQRAGLVELAPGVEIDAGKCWLVAPRKHKTAHRNHGRVILFGPQAQEVLKPLLEGRPADRPIFSPAEAVKAWRDAQRAVRRTKVQPSQVSRAKPSRSRPPSDYYDVRAYGRAIARACQAAGVPHWHPHQLRHSAATNISRQFGREIARIILGHSTQRMTHVYALDNLPSAIEAMEKAG